MATSVNVMGEPPVSGLQMVQIAYLQWLEGQESERATKYQECRDYYEGDHLTALTTRLRKFLELREGQEFSLNMCPIVVDALADKLKVARFECGKNDKLVADWWKKNRMDSEQAVVHLAAVRDGDTYVLVEYDSDAGHPMWGQENAYNGTDGVIVLYRDEHHREPLVAIKRWTITNGSDAATRRLNLYYADRVEKYTDGGTGSSWTPYVDEWAVDEAGEVSEVWPIPWVDQQGEPLGIPVAHFRNKDQGYSYGLAELNDVIPQQNGLNKAVVDVITAGDTTAFQQPYMIGAKPPSEKVPGAWVYTENPDATIGVIEAGDLSSLLELKDSFCADIAKITRTPLSFFQITGQVAAAGTLKEQRAGLIAKARNRQPTFGNSWEDVLALAFKLEATFGSASVDLEAETDCVWEDDEKPDPKELAETAELLTRAGAMSVKEKVKMLHPEWDEKRVKEEVEAIRDEMGLNVENPDEYLPDGARNEAEAQGQVAGAGVPGVRPPAAAEPATQT